MRTFISTLVISILCGMTGLYLFGDGSTSGTEIDYSALPDSIRRNPPPCIRLHECIVKYAEEYEIPMDYAFGIAYQETRYSGAFHWKYDHRQTSFAGALGPMQVMYATAKGLFPKREFTREQLRDDIDFNVHCSMKLLRRLYERHGDWKLVFGAYNTGRPLVNGYAINVYNFRK